MLHVNSISKSFGNIRAVDSITFDVLPGHIFGLIGPNGAGKSTSIRMIMNIFAPDSGTILLNGETLSERHKARIGYLPEERGTYKKDRVDDFLLFLAELKGMKHLAAKKSIYTWLERFGIADRAGAKISELSKGMTQKVQFIGAVAHNPDLLLFDEPFSGLDPISQETLLSAMTELSLAGKTVLFSTHIMEHAEKICSKIFMINRGREVVSGELSEIKAEHGRNAVVIDFDGDAAFLGTLDEVESCAMFPRNCELTLKSGASAQAVLKAAAQRLRISRFELMEPSLHKIFISLAGSSPAESHGDKND